MYPKMVICAKTPVKVVIESGDINEYGEVETLINRDFKCNFQDKATVKRTNDKQFSEITGCVLIDGDILPETSVISSGYIIIYGVKRNIVSGQKARNPDGSVNYTRLDVK